MNDQHPLYAALGLDIGGEEVYVDVDKMPHGLFAGTTGSGKSVCMNSILVSLLYRNTPEQLRLILITNLKTHDRQTRNIQTLDLRCY